MIETALGQSGMPVSTERRAAVVGATDTVLMPLQELDCDPVGTGACS